MNVLYNDNRYEKDKKNEKVTNYNYNINLNLLNCYDSCIFADSNIGTHLAIMVENTYNDNVYIVLKQMSRFLSNIWSMHIYVTEDIYEKYCIMAACLENNIKIFITDNNIKDKNIMLNLDFLKKLVRFDKLLIFNLNSMLYKYGIEQFLNYDYINYGDDKLKLISVKKMVYFLENIKNKSITDEYMEEHNYNIPENNILLKQFFDTSIEQNLYKSVSPYCNLMTVDVSTHRHGWKYVNSVFSNFFGNKSDIILSTYNDCSYNFNPNFYLGRKWVGIFHLIPLKTKKYFKICDLNRLRYNKKFIADLKFCEGIFVLSNYLKNIVDSMFKQMGFNNILVDMVKHPTFIDNKMFNPSKIGKIKNIVSLGSQLRYNSTIFKLNSKLKKVWLSGRDKDTSLDILKEECDEYNISLSSKEISNVSIIRLSDDDYDNMIVNSYIIVHLVDSSANNGLIECIVKNIPLFINKLPSVVEYIGEEYPLFFETVSELEKMLNDTKLIKSGYKYLKNRPELKDALKMDQFIKGIVNSRITKKVLRC